MLGIALLLGHGTAIQGIKTVKEFKKMESLMVAETKQWLDACACIQSTDRTRSVSSHMLEPLTLVSRARNMQLALVHALRVTKPV